MNRQWTRLSQILLGLCAALALCLAALSALARTREPNNIYAERRARLRAQLDGPVVLFGFTGKENSSPSYVFSQQEDFYYLTGHNEEGAALLLIPATAAGKSWAGPAEILFLPQRNPVTERWGGPRMGPTDAGVSERTGFESVQPFSVLKGELENLSKVFTNFYAILPKDNERGYPHSKTWANWLSQVLPQSSTRDISAKIAALRQVKSPSEIELLTRAIDLSVDAHIEAMKTMRPGIYEYEVAARMEYVMKSGGCEGPAYAPIVGSGFYSTVLHYNDLTQKIQPGEIAVLDVGCSYSGYAADITRTLPADGKFTPRQREIYEIVLGAQNAALAALKPGMTMGRGPNGLQKIAFEYINTHGKDKDGKPLGRYFIHGLGHHIGLNVHDAGLNDRPLEPGMVITIEPGIYIPEENLGVRIEDDVLITETGYKLLSARLPRTVDEVERIMAVARKAGPGEVRLLHMVAPVYPPLAHLARIQGDVSVDLTVSDNGKVSALKSQSGHPLLKVAAEEALREWSFEVGCGVQTPYTQNVVVEFRVEGEPVPYPWKVSAKYESDLPKRIRVTLPPALPSHNAAKLQAR